MTVRELMLQLGRLDPMARVGIVIRDEKCQEDEAHSSGYAHSITIGEWMEKNTVELIAEEW